MSEETPNDKGKPINPFNRLTIAAAIIGISVIILGFILSANLSANDELGDLTSKLTTAKNYTTVFKNGTTITTTIYVTPPETLTQVLKDLTQTRKDTNQQMLTTLMTAISAWIGAIIAFYFGKDYLVKLADTNKELIVANTKLASNIGGKPKTETINDLLSQKPDSSNVVSYKLEDKVDNKEIKKSLEKYGSTFLFTKDEKGKYIAPCGMLYKSGWEAANHIHEHVTSLNDAKQLLTKSATPESDTSQNKNVQDMANQLDKNIEDITQKIGLDAKSFEKLAKAGILNLVKDKITEKLWDKEHGFDNFEKAHSSDKIADTLKSMKRFDSKVIGNVFVLVFSDDDSSLRGILGHSDLVNASETASKS